MSVVELNNAKSKTTVIDRKKKAALAKNNLNRKAIPISNNEIIFDKNAGRHLASQMHQQKMVQ